MFSVAVLFALALTAVFLTIAVGDDRITEAQQITTIQVTPDNFGTYFDIDATTEVATLNSAYASDHTLVLGPGVYRNSILVENASNLVIRGANKADSDQPAALQANRIIESARGAGNGAIFQVRSSSNVTVDNLLFDYQCLFDASPRTALYGLFFQDTSGGTISNNVMENYWYAFGRDEDGNTLPNPCGDLTRGLGDILFGIPTSLNRASFRAIRVDMTSSHVPDIDANGKVTNLLPIRIAGNKISRVDRLGIGIYGYFDATIEDNTIHDANTVMQITGGADAKVLNNHISYTTVALIYAPHWFVRNSPDGETVNAEIEVRGNVIDGASGGAIQLGFAFASATDGTTVHTDAKIIGNHFLNLRQDRAASVGNSVGISVYSDHNEGEQIRAEVIGNTFEQRSSDSDNDPTGIYGSSAYLAGASSSTWFDLKAHYNAFIGFQEREGRGVWITNKEGATTFPVANARVHASHNYWGPELRIPPDFIEDDVDQPDIAGITSAPYLIDPELAGHTGPYGTGARSVPSELPEVVRFTASPSSLTVVEGQTASFDVALESAPSRDVLITLIANNPDISISPSSLTFTPEDWDTPRTVWVRAGEDHDVDSETAILGALITDADYPNGYVALVDVQIQDLGLQAHHRINRLAPSISEVNVRGGDTIRLGVVPYGRQNIADDALIDGKTGVIWTVDGDSGSFAEADPSLDTDTLANDRVVEFTAPDSPGRYTIHATLVSCGDATGEDCRASFTVFVRRSSPPPEPTVAPTNPRGDIPSILADSDGNQYEVFTPEEGGSFIGEGFSIKAPPSAVPNGEVVGLRMHNVGPASNAGMTAHRYTLVGNSYAVSAVEASSASIASYILKSPAEVCVPLPQAARSNISDVALVVTNSDGSLTILSGTVRLGALDTRVCGSLSELPAIVAVGTAGSPAALPTAMPEQPEAEQLPETGGYAPDAAFWAMLFIFIIGLITVGSSFGFAFSLRQRSGRR